MDDPSTLWTVDFLTLWVIRPLCGLKYSHTMGDPSTLWIVNILTLLVIRPL